MIHIDEAIAETICELRKSLNESGDNVTIETMVVKWHMLKVLLTELGILDRVFVDEAPGRRCLEEEAVQA